MWRVANYPSEMLSLPFEIFVISIATETLDSTRSVRVDVKLWAQKHELPSKLQFFPHTSANVSSITRALGGPWPQRGVDFFARECCQHSFTARECGRLLEGIRLGQVVQRSEAHYGFGIGVCELDGYC